MSKITVWVVVLVESGISTYVEVFRNSKDANYKKDSLVRTINPEDDEVGIFEVEIK